MIDRFAFVERFGGVFEQSPWVAERGYDRLLNPEPLRAGPIHAALCHVFREASREERLGVLLAHPDLAGKFVVSELTEASRAEQASAGLDRLTPEEHRQFTEFNERYRMKFGFPFILAVKGLGKGDILEAFQRRIGHDAAEEFTTACDEVEKIARLRLQALLPENGNGK